MSRTRAQLVSRALARLGVTGTDSVSATKTRADLVNAILVRLGVAAAGQSVSAEDNALVDGEVQAIVDGLKQRQVYAVADLAAIDSAAFHDIATVGAFTMARDFGFEEADRALLMQDATRAEAALRRMNATQFGALVDAEWPSVAQDLLERQVYNVADIDDIDDAAFQPLSALLAWEFAEEIGARTGADLKVLAADVARAEPRLRLLGHVEASEQPVTATYY